MFSLRLSCSAASAAAEKKSHHITAPPPPTSLSFAPSCAVSGAPEAPSVPRVDDSEPAQGARREGGPAGDAQARGGVRVDHPEGCRHAHGPRRHAGASSRAGETVGDSRKEARRGEGEEADSGNQVKNRTGPSFGFVFSGMSREI